MPSLKELRGRINSVKSTQKITSAMKMVAASKLRRAQSAGGSRPALCRADGADAVALAATVQGSPTAPQLLAGTGKDQTHLLIAVTADRGLAGAFNTNIGRMTRNLARKLESEGKTVKILAGRPQGSRLPTPRDGRPHRSATSAMPARRTSSSSMRGYRQARDGMMASGEFDVCTIVYNRFRSVISQVVDEQRLVPAPMPEGAKTADTGARAIYEFEPDEETILAKLLPQALAVQTYRALLESAAGEHAARMTAMDNATRNAGDMIKRLTLNYNRARQANITKELIEIISGAEAV